MTQTWKSFPLGEVVDVVSGQVDPRREPYVLMPHIGSDNIESGTGRIDGVRTARDLELISGKYTFSPEHVLYSKIRPALNKVAVPDFAGICSADIYALSPKRSVLSRRFLAYLLRSPGFLDYASKHSSRTNIPKLNRESLLSYTAVLPPLSEQRRIAAILDKADDLRAKRREALAKVDGLAQSVFVEMCGESAEVLRRWPVVELGALLDFLTSGSRGWAQHYSSTGALFLRIQNVGRNEMLLDDVAFVEAPDTAEARRTKVCPGDVLLSITADLGRTGVVPQAIGDAFINQHLAILRTSRLSPHFLSAYLSSASGQAQILKKNRQGVKAGLNFDDIRSLRIPVPPADIQSGFARCLHGSTTLKHSQRTSSEVLDTLFASLQHRAFCGAL